MLLRKEGNSSGFGNTEIMILIHFYFQNKFIEGLLTHVNIQAGQICDRLYSFHSQYLTLLTVTPLPLLHFFFNITPLTLIMLQTR